MPGLPCWTFKDTPDPVVPPLPPPMMVEEPTLSVYYPFECSSPVAILTLDKMPVFDREPDHIPDIPGGGGSYVGGWIEYRDLGVSLGPSVGRWSGVGGKDWTVLIDGDPYTTFSMYDGTPGPIAVEVDILGFDFSVPHAWSIEATYHDRPDYRSYWFDPASIGIIAFGGCGFAGCSCSGIPCFCTCPGKCSCPPCCCEIIGGASIGWDSPGYWQPWVSDHHNVHDVLGPVDRKGNYLGLTGPWFTNVPKQFFISNEACLCCTAECGYVYAVGLTDLMNVVTYPEISFPVRTTPVVLPPCSSTPSRVAVFDPMKPHKAG